jgi:nitrogen-specific signal transduction histidine kinase
MSMQWLKRFERQIFPFAAAVLVASLIFAVWGMGMRETSNRRLYLELEAYRTLTALTDLVRAGGLNRDDIQRVIAFGLYSSDGKAIYRHGDAPFQLEAVGPDSVPSRMEIGEDSIVLHRLLGNDYPGRRPGPVQMGRMRRDMPMATDPVPAMAYINYSLGDFAVRQASLMATLLTLSFALVGLYAVLIIMYRRYVSAADREARNRELVELGEAARTIVHEIKNPLGVIRIQCGLLRRGADSATSSGLAVIEDEVLRLTMMADRIRDYLGRSDKPTESVNMRNLLNGFLERYTGAVNFEIRLAGDEVVRADGNRLVEALDNIIANAREAVAGRDEIPQVEAFYRQQRLLIQVSDKGPGVAPEIRKNLFEPFFTTKPRGTGLGLALARKNLEASGGTLSFSERPGGGSIFTITLPFSRTD